MVILGVIAFAVIAIIGIAFAILVVLAEMNKPN